MKHTLIRFCSTLFACVLLAICASAQPTTSTQLFQEWEAARDTHPQIPNNTTAGYRRGEASIPNVPVVNNVVTDFGADPTGNADNTEAFWRAIWDAHEQGGGAVFIPNGNYRIDGFLWMRFDGVVLRGESQSGVHLHFTRHLTDVVGEDTTGSKSKYSWLGGLIWMSGSRAFDVGYSYARNYPDTPFGTDWRTGRYSARTSEFWVDNDFTRRTLTSVTADAEIGDNVLQVADASGVRAGDWVILRFYISGTDNAFQRQLAGSNHVADNYNWAFHSTIRYADSKGYTWPVQIAAVNGNVVTLAQALRTAVKTDWQPHLIELNSLAPLYEAGVENLTIRLNSNNEGTYQHLNDRGWNGIFINRAVNCWVRNVTVADGENGVLVAAGKQITVSNVTLTEFTTRLNTWHHGFTARVMSADLLFEDFVFDVNHRIDHGINSEAFASGLVWRNGTMYKGTFDSHRVIPFDQIRTNIFVVNPAGSGSGGDNDNGLHAGKRLVHWNITAVDRGIWVNHEELFSGGAMVGFFRSGLTGCANQASTVCGTAQQKNTIFLEQNTVPAITDLHLAQVQSVRDAYGYVAIVTPAAQTLTVDQGVPQVRIEGAVPSGRTLQTVQLLSNGTVIASTNSLPWDYTWSNVPLGEHMLTARIIDNTGASVESIPTRFVRAQRVLVDEDDADLLRSSGWFSEFNANHHNGKAQRNNTNGSWLEYTFKGTRVVFFGYNYANTTSNAMRIYINGQFVDYVTDRSGGVFQVPIWISPELPEAVYTIRFEFEPHAANASTRALFDYLHIYSTGPVDGAPPAIPGSVDVTPAFATIETNGSAQFTALLRDTNGNIMSPQPSSFNWSVSGGGTISGSGLFSSDGSVGTFTVSASSQSVQGSATVQVTAAQGGGGSSNTYLEANGIVVMEAERYSDNLLNGDFLEWEDSQAGSGFAGTGYVTMTTNASGSRNWPTGAELVYEVVITNPGTYYMNIRRIAPSSAFDSIHIGVNGSLVAAKAFEGSQTTWAWAPSARIVNLGHLPAGLNTIHIQRREPGMSIDRIMLASQIADLPQNTGIIGPEESATVGGQVIPPEVELFSPVANALFPFGSSVELVATVEENENVIESVDFIVNGTWVGSATSAPWTVWTPALSEGIYEVVVEVYVDGQLAVSSDPVEFEVEAPIGNSSTYIEQNGTVVIEAENFADFQSNGDWLVWDVSNAGSGYAGSGYVTMTTQASGSLNWPNGAELIYEVWINNPGTYYMNIRRIAPSSAFDSIHVGVNGNLVAAKVFEGSQTTWAWAPSARIVNLGNLSAGLNTIHIQRREPGMSIDRIMLASTLADLPVNTGAIGPDESPTQGAANPPPPPEEPVILTIPVVEDAYVRAGNSANTAHGTTDATRLVSKGALSSEPQFLREAYLKFDIRQLDPQLILGATVEVVGSLSDDRDTNITTYLHGVASSNWSETTVTWNNKPARDLTAYSSVVVTDDIDRVYSFDVSSLLVDALQQNAEYVTFALVNTQNTNPTTIWHSKETVGGIAAQLVVEAIGGGGNPGNQVDDPQILLTPLADAYTQGGPNANTAYGTSNSQELVVKAIDLNSDFGFHREAMLSFEVPNHIHTLREAKLRLYGNLSSTAGNNIKTFVYAAVDNGWDEATVTHNTRPPRAYVPLDEQTITNGAPTWYEWDVTPFLQHAQENGWSTVTLVLANTQVTSPFTTFHSKENPSGNSPELVLDYEPDVPWVTASFDWNPQVVSYLGGSSDSERVVASFIRADGNLVLVANYGPEVPAGVQPILLNGASSSSLGSVIILSPDASQIVSITKVGTSVIDAALAANDDLVIALGSQGVVKLNSTASQLLWHFDGAGASLNAQRVSIAQDGHVAFLSANPVNQSNSRDLHSGGRIRVLNPNGTLRADWAAHLQCQNVTIDSHLGRVYTTGYNQTFGGPNPVQIAYIRSQDFDGSVTHWTAYDWTGNQLEPAATPGVINNMADTRGYQVLIGPDGMLYAAMEAAGGNHIFRWDPFDLNTAVTLVGGDSYHQFFNSYSDHKLVIIRMDPLTAEVDRFQQFTARVGNAGRTNGARMIRGKMQVDNQGRIHVVTDTASGGDSAAKTFLVGLPLSYNPVPVTEYGGGGAYLILSPDMTTRLHLARIGSRVRPWALHVRQLSGDVLPRVIYGGATENFPAVELPQLQPLQGTRGSTIDGYFSFTHFE